MIAQEMQGVIDLNAAFKARNNVPEYLLSKGPIFDLSAAEEFAAPLGQETLTATYHNYFWYALIRTGKWRQACVKNRFWVALMEDKEMDMGTSIQLPLAVSDLFAFAG